MAHYGPVVGVLVENPAVPCRRGLTCNPQPLPRSPGCQSLLFRAPHAFPTHSTKIGWPSFAIFRMRFRRIQSLVCPSQGPFCTAGNAPHPVMQDLVPAFPC